MSYYFSTALFISVVAAFATLLPSPTLSTSLAANVTGKDGQFYAHLLIGTPPTLGSLVLDTDSDLIWTHHCNKASASYSRIVPCNSLLCSKAKGVCGQSNNFCQYKYLSTNLTTFPVDLATETFTIGDSVSKLISSCGALETETGGLGLGRSPPSLVSQMNANTFSYCLQEYDDVHKKGFLLVGSLARSHPNMTSTRLVSNSLNPSPYYISVIGISVNKVRLSIPTSAFEINEKNGAGGTIIDTGSTVSYFNDKIFDPLVNQIKKTIRLKPTSSPKGVDLNNCFSIPSNNSYKLPRITFHFSKSSSLTLSAANTFRMYTVPKTNQSVVCLAMEKALSSDKGMSRFGNVQQLNTVVFFNLAKQTVGFLPTTQCDKMPNH